MQQLYLNNFYRKLLHSQFLENVEIVYRSIHWREKAEDRCDILFPDLLPENFVIFKAPRVSTDDD